MQRDNCYWTIVEIEPFRIEKMEVLSPNMVKVEVYKNWDMDKYCDSVKVGNEDGYFIALYDVERIQNEWLITSKGYKH